MSKERLQLFYWSLFNPVILLYKIILYSNMCHIENENLWIYFLLYLGRNIHFEIGVRVTHDSQDIYLMMVQYPIIVFFSYLLLSNMICRECFQPN